MRPRLHSSGSPVGQHKPQGATVTFLCLCWDCYDKTTLDVVTRQFVNGQYLGRHEYAKHQRKLKRSEIAPPTALASQPQSPTSIQPLQECPASPPQPSDVIPDAPPPTRKERRSRKPFEVDSWNQHLRLVQDQLDDPGRFHLDSHGIEQLVFCSPPTFSSPPVELTREPSPEVGQDINSGPYALKYDVGANAAFITYEEWLFDTAIAIEGGLKHGEASIRLRTTTLRRNLARALGGLEQVKRDEWERRRVNAVHVPSTGDSSNQPNRIETGTKSTCCQSIGC
jgi:hypothetical protein